NEARRGDVDDGARRRLGALEDGEQRAHGLARAHEADYRFSNDAHGSFGADENAGEIVSRRIRHAAAEPNDLAAGEHDLDPEYVIDGDAVGERVRAAGIVRDVAADRARRLAARIGRVEKPVLGDRLRDFQIDDAGLDDGDAIFEIDFEDAVEARERQDDAAFGRHRAAGEAGSRAARHDRHAGFARGAHDRRDFRPACGDDDDLRHRLEDRAVLLVDDDVFSLDQDELLADDGAQLVDEGAGSHGARSLSEATPAVKYGLDYFIDANQEVYYKPPVTFL